MTKAELIKKLSVASGGTVAICERDFDILCDVIKEELIKGEEIPLTGIGKFKVKLRPARQGRNPRTGEPLTIPAGKKVIFSVSKTLKDLL